MTREEYEIDVDPQDLLAENAGLRLEILELRSKLERAEKLSVQDALTGITNRRGIEDAMDRETKRNQRTGDCAAFMMVDIDHFKSFNDTYGHDAGDRVLIAVAETIDRMCRGSDHCGRFGGEEFAMVVGGLNVDAYRKAEMFAERVRGAVELVEVAGLPQVTVSVGVAVAEPGDDWKQALKRADGALYEAKNAGRNRVEVAG